MKKITLLLALLIYILPLAASDTLSVVAVGDIMLGTAYPSREYLPPQNNCSPLLKALKPYLEKADVTFGNLEGAMTDNLQNAKKCANPAVCYAFAMPTAYSSCLAAAGFDLLSIANNHTGDFGMAGRKSTTDALDRVGIAYAGLLSCPSTIIERNGLKIGFCAFAPNTGTCSVNDVEAAKKIVRDLKAKSDVVIVSFHAGAEGSKMSHVTRKREFFVGEDRGNVYEFARQMIDAGGDILLGHGPHVTRAVDMYKGRFITYSMGNFCTYSRINLNGISGLAPLFKIYTNRKGEFIKAETIATYQTKGAAPAVDSQKRVIKEIQALMKQDFPESQLSMDANGLITKK